MVEKTVLTPPLIVGGGFMFSLRPVFTAIQLLRTLLLTEGSILKSYPWAEMALPSTLTWSFGVLVRPPLLPSERHWPDRTYAERNGSFPPKLGK
jgi:hypothetical protein